MKAASDPTRRAILTLLAQQGPLRVTDIHRQFELSLNAISKHIKMLERAGLVRRRTEWREHLIDVNLGPISEMDRWFGSLRSIWELRLEALENAIMEGSTDMTDLTLTVERTIGAPRNKVFAAWLEPAMLKRFMLPGDGMSVPVARTDPREGGRFEIVMRAGDRDIPHAGTYREIRPHDRIVFTWESPFSTEGSEVTLTFADDGAGTRVRLSHVRFPNEESRSNHEAGWTAILAALGAALA